MRFAGLLLGGIATCATAQVTTTREYLQRMDTNGDGKVQLAEYQNWLIYAFDQMDTNRDGLLTPDERPGRKGRTLLRSEQMKLFAERFKRQDGNHDGVLDARELAAPPQ